jgi:MFS family permease
MQSLDETYSRRGTDGNRRRVLAGAGLGLAGALAVLAAILLVALAGTDLTARAWAGVLAGLGIPAMLSGVVVVLPADRRSRAGVLAGSGLTVVGTALFWEAYPDRWLGTADPLTFETTVVYTLGGAVALWFVFVAVANFRRRNDPHGTVTMRLTRDGGTRTVEVSRQKYRQVREAVGDGGSSEVIEDLLEE